MKTKFYIVLVLLIFLLGFFLRAQETLSGNFLFLLDQGRDLLAVKRIVFDHHLTLIGPYTSLQGVFQGPFWYYLLAIPIFIFNGNPWGTILLMFLMSMSAICIAYWLTNKVFGKNAAIAVLFLFAVSPEAVAAATYSWNPHPMWLLVTLYIFVFYAVLVMQKKNYHLALWPLLSLMFHFQTALGVTLFLATLLFFLVFKREGMGKKFFLGLLLSVLIFLPQMAFDARHDFLMTKSVLSLFQGSDQGLYVSNENNGYLSLLKTHVDSFYYNFQTTFLRDGYLEKLPIVMLLFIVFMLLFGKKQLLSEKEYYFLTAMGKLVLIVALLFIFAYPFPIRYWFLTGFQAIYIIICGVLLGALWKHRIGKWLILFLVIVILFYDGQRLVHLYEKSDYGGTAKIKGKIDVLDYIYQDAKGKPFGLLVFAPPVYTDQYDYLVWWYGKRKYGYVPSDRKEGVFYLLIEPDSSKPWSYQGWLETVIKTGTVLETKELPSGFIIQKRLEEKSNEI